jgi:hypothetical protein
LRKDQQFEVYKITSNNVVYGIYPFFVGGGQGFVEKILRMRGA